uniref:tRNA (cytosine(72)-C(5))-methyltransferase n=3 Tax=Staphylothermus marinus TaxID=2280 RepID=A0A7J3KEM6_STAMA
MFKLDDLIVASIRRVYGSLTNELIGKLAEPPRRLYLRVNTLRISRDELIFRLRERGVDAKPDSYVEEAIYIELKGPYKVPKLDKVIYVDRNTAESVMMGSNLYRPGVQKFSSFNKGDEVTVLSPSGEPVAVVETVVSSNEVLGMVKGLVGINKVSKYRAPPIRELPEYVNGLIYSQSLPSMIATKLLEPVWNDFIVDLNAAPGGKSTHVIQLTGSRVKLLSIDRNMKKCLKMKEEFSRLFTGYNVNIIRMDSRYLDRDLYGLENRVDKVIIDPPCSALGVRPKTNPSISGRDMLDLRNYQYQFLKVASRIVRGNGLILYSTCTLTFDENEYNVLQAIRNLNLEPVEVIQPPYSEKIRYGEVVAYRYSPLTYDMPGFFISLLRKK